jgi:hypothetical protein
MGHESRNPDQSLALLGLGRMASSGATRRAVCVAMGHESRHPDQFLALLGLGRMASSGATRRAVCVAMGHESRHPDQFSQTFLNVSETSTSDRGARPFILDLAICDRMIGW